MCGDCVPVNVDCDLKIGDLGRAAPPTPDGGDEAGTGGGDSGGDDEESDGGGGGEDGGGAVAARGPGGCPGRHACLRASEVGGCW